MENDPSAVSARPPRVAHLNFIDEPGVTRKLRDEAAAARGLGLPIDYYLIDSGFEDGDDGLIKYRHRAPDSGVKLFRFLKMLTEREDLVSDYIDPGSYDMFIVRFGKMFVGQGITYRRHGDRIATEHHSDEMAELRYKKSFERRVLAWFSERRSRAALRRVAGIVAVTREIQELELRKSGPKPSLVMPNGINVPQGDPPRRAYSPGEPLRLAFVAANFQPWQGLDRLLAAARSYEGEAPIELHIVGRLEPDQASDIASFPRKDNVRIEAHGLLPASDMPKLYASCHLGVASLASSRKRMFEVCSLKNREYLAWGLPLVYVYPDSDIPSDWPYGIRLPDLPGTIALEDVARFAERLYAGGDPSPAIRAFAREHMDWKAKISMLYSFISSLWEARGPSPSATRGAGDR